jgi:hypothetical protein
VEKQRAFYEGAPVGVLARRSEAALWRYLSEAFPPPTNTAAMFMAVPGQ